jgi:hypothetical protein
VFTAFGDQGVSNADALANDTLILGQNPAFHLHAGDICYADTNGHGKKSDGYDPTVPGTCSSSRPSRSPGPSRGW